MTSCQISLAAMRFFKSYFAYCFSLVFLKQEIWSEGTIKKSINAVVCWRKKVATMRGLLDEIQLFLVVTPYWRAPERAKQLSMATIPLCFEFFRVVLMSCRAKFSRSTISITVFCLQNLICLLFSFADQVFIDPTFSGIFVCGPLQCFVVNVCTINLLRFCWRYRVGLTNLHAMFVGEINYKHFADSSGAYKRAQVAGKEELNFKDLQ